jgi:signal peptidase II
LSTRPPASAGSSATPRSRGLPLALGVAVATLAADQLTKSWAVSRLDTETIDLFWTLRLQLTFNQGSAFSVGWGRFVPLLAILVVAVVVLMVRLGTETTSRVALVGIGFVIGGAVGNLVDRAFRAGEGFMGGRVVDFIDLQWWPVFNVADMGLVVGAVLVVLSTGRGAPTQRAPAPRS